MQSKHKAGTALGIALPFLGATAVCFGSWVFQSAQ